MDNPTEQDTSCLPEPLTRKNADGEIYQRESVVDRQIQEALILDAEELARRSKVTDKVSGDFLKEESLVYLIRHYQNVGNRRIVNVLSESLLGRCATLINDRLRRLGELAAEEGYSEVVTTLFCRILDLDSNQGDFLQVRFWIVLKSLTVQAFRNQLNLSKHERDNFPSATPEGHDSVDTDTMSHENGARILGTKTTRTVESEVIDKLLVRRALSQLKEPLRTVYLLRNYWGWPIEDKDLDVRTISQRFTKSPRTIRNWLNTANKCLEAWREEIRDEQTK